MPGTRWRIRETGVSWRDVNGEIIALDLESSSYFTTNRSGSLMWHQLIDSSTSDELVDLLQSTYGIPLEQCRRDVDAFIEVLREHHLLADQD